MSEKLINLDNLTYYDSKIKEYIDTLFDNVAEEIDIVNLFGVDNDESVATFWTNDDIILTAIITKSDYRLYGSYNVQITNDDKIATNNLTYHYDWTVDNGNYVEPNGGQNTSYVSLEDTGSGNYTLTVTCGGTLVDEYGNSSEINKTVTATDYYEYEDVSGSVELSLTESAPYKLTVSYLDYYGCEVESIALYKDGVQYGDLTPELDISDIVNMGTSKVFDLTEFIDQDGTYFVRFVFTNDAGEFDSNEVTIITEAVAGAYTADGTFSNRVYTWDQIVANGENYTEPYYVEDELYANFYDIIVPETVTDCGYFYCKNIVLPETTTHVHGNDNSEMGYVYIKATTPPTLDEYAFYECTDVLINEDERYSTGTFDGIIVPIGCGEAYKNAPNWSIYEKYIAEGEMPI